MTTTTADHACDACGGTGRELGLCGRGCTHWTELCPVCLGAGRISNRMPVRDAIADAETLRLFVRVHSAVNLRIGSLLDNTAYSHYEEASPEENWAVSSYAARAAFHAVPGLRGE